VTAAGTPTRPDAESTPHRPIDPPVPTGLGDPSASSSLEAERRFAIAAVVAASRLTRAVRRDFDPSHAAAKADASPVTVADLGAQVLVSMALAEALPGDGLMGEEDFGPLAASADLAGAVLARVREQRSETTLDELRLALDRCDDVGGPGRRWWTLDPVDGTKGFLRNEQYAVALALVEDGEVVLAAMACPNLPLAGEPRGSEDMAAAPGPADTRDPAALGCLFIAERGRGAIMLPLDEAATGAPGIPIRAASPASASGGRYAESVEAAHSDQSASVRIGELLGITAEPLRLDSQTKYAVVARGDASIYLRLPRGGYVENVWDHAAGFLIVTEAGGRVSDVQGRPLDFTTGTRMTANSGIVATAASIHDAVVAAVRSVLEA
jgi:HAL2 family 3'(2'),5'-bisphosphate nucleotidase